MQEQWSRTAVRRRVNDELEKARFAERTRRAYQRWTYAYLDAIACDAPIAAEHAQRFLNELKGPAGTLRQARSALNFLLEVTTGERVDLHIDEPAQTRHQPRFLCAEQAAAILSHAEGVAGLAAHLIHDTGVSVVEVACLAIDSFSADLDTLTPPTRTTGSPTVPIPVEAQRRIQLHLTSLRETFDIMADGQFVWEAQYLLPSGQDYTDPKRLWRHLSDETIHRYIGRCFESAGLDPSRASSTLQNTFARRMLENGAAPAEVSAWMGRSTTLPSLRILHAMRQPHTAQ